MIALYEAIRSRNPQGISYEDAVQLYLLVFCTTDDLPDALKRERIMDQSNGTVVWEIGASFSTDRVRPCLASARSGLPIRVSLQRS